MNNSTLKLNNTHPWLYGLIGLSLNFVIGFAIRAYVVEARYIPSGSMEPTLQINDRLFVEKITYKIHPPARGDIVVFNAPQKMLEAVSIKDDDAIISRVIGLPGEMIEVKNNTVFVDGHPLEEGYIKEAPAYMWGPGTVPAKAYLVLSDNRNQVMDSHIWGYLPEGNMIGRATFRFWPVSRVGGLE